VRRTTAWSGGELQEGESAGQCSGGHTSGVGAHPSAKESTGGVSLGKLASSAAVISTPARRAAASKPYGGSVAEKRSVAMPLTSSASSHASRRAHPPRLIWHAATRGFWRVEGGGRAGALKWYFANSRPAGVMTTQGCRASRRQPWAASAVSGLTWRCEADAPPELGVVGTEGTSQTRTRARRTLSSHRRLPTSPKRQTVSAKGPRRARTEGAKRGALGVGRGWAVRSDTHGGVPSQARGGASGEPGGDIPWRGLRSGARCSEERGVRQHLTTKAREPSRRLRASVATTPRGRPQQRDPRAALAPSAPRGRDSWRGLRECVW
jgi:hypothetical protein